MTALERQQQSEIERLRQENHLLREKLDLVIRQLFGKKSEKLDLAQLELLLGAPSPAGEGDGPGKPEASGALEEELREAEKADKYRPARNKERHPRLPENLPVVETILCPDPVNACPDAWRRIGEEVSEQLDYQPGKFQLIRTVRPKYVRIADHDAPPVIAELPAKLIESGIPTAGLLTQIVVAKFCDHQPLYRQEQIFKSRHDVQIPRQTMCRWVECVAGWLKPIYQEMRRQMFSLNSYIQIDETPIRYLEPGNGKTEQGYLWTYRIPNQPHREKGGDVLFDWHPGRGHECLTEFLPVSYRGTIGCDGYGAYQTFAGLDGHEIGLAGCWAHARRKIYEALETAGGSPTGRRAAWLLRQVQNLYQIERKLRESRAGPALREATRQAQSRPVIDRFFRALEKIKASTKNRILPQSQMGKAINYALNQREKLYVYLGDGRIEIDNNQVENAIRPTKLGAKNWLFIGSEGAGWRSAVIYSLIESCRTRGIDPYAYLKDVLTRLPDATNWEIPSMTPAAWKAAREKATKLARVS